METLTVYPRKKGESEALIAFLNSLKIKFESNQVTYNQDFVEKIMRSDDQIAKGQYTAIKTEDLWK